MMSAGPRLAGVASWLVRREYSVFFWLNRIVKTCWRLSSGSSPAAALIWRYYEELRELWLKDKGYVLHRSKTGYTITVVSFIALLLFGWGATQFVGVQERDIVNQRAKSEAALISGSIKESLSESDRAVQVRSMSPWIVPFLGSNTPQNLANANIILDRFAKYFNLDVSYILDLKGTAIASSNRAEPKSFVGRNFDFRPYFQRSLTGKTSAYLAVSFISGDRGYYSGAPVYSNGKVVGVIAAKKSIEKIEAAIDPDCTALLADKDGVIFLSTKKDLLYRALWPIDEKTAQEKIKSQQYEHINTDPIISSKLNNDQLLTFSGKKLLVSV
jgi:C4-dicarboxylate-specific signal transduction histidine kinase